MLDPHEKILLERTAATSQENHEMLRKLVRAQRWAQFGTFLRWLVLLASIAGAYYYLQPYLNSLITTYQKVTKTLPAALSDLNLLPNGTTAPSPKSVKETWTLPPPLPPL